MPGSHRLTIVARSYPHARATDRVSGAGARSGVGRTTTSGEEVDRPSRLSGSPNCRATNARAAALQGAHSWLELPTSCGLPTRLPSVANVSWAVLGPLPANA